MVPLGRSKSPFAWESSKAQRVAANIPFKEQEGPSGKGPEHLGHHSPWPGARVFWVSLHVRSSGPFLRVPSLPSLLPSCCLGCAVTLKGRGRSPHQRWWAEPEGRRGAWLASGHVIANHGGFRSPGLLERMAWSVAETLSCWATRVPDQPSLCLERCGTSPSARKEG